VTAITDPDRAALDLEGLGLDAGGHILIDRALGPLPVDGVLTLQGRHGDLPVHLAGWCRTEGHRLIEIDRADGLTVARIGKGRAHDARWTGAERAGTPTTPAGRADPAWGLAARGALVETGGPRLEVDWVDRDLVWAEVAPQLYAAAAAGQWDPATAVAWSSAPPVLGDLETAVVQVMTYLIENEQAALLVPARLLGQLHPQFREVMQLLASQIADEARHIEVFSRRATLHRAELGSSSAGGRASLQSLLAEPDFTLATFLLSVLGEGTFVDLLRFLHEHAPDQATADATRLAARDEARHVAFGVAHTAHVARADPGFLVRMRQAVERRHDQLIDTAGINQGVFDSLVVLAAGGWRPSDIARGWQAVAELQARMDQGRQHRLAYIGFPDDEARELSALHTRNFM
jgi:hypothetical protein